MDKIRQALDRARRERDELHEVGEPSAWARDRAIDVPALPIAAPVIARSPEPPAKVFADAIERDDPSRARTFEPDAAALEAHRVLPPGGRSTASSAFQFLRTQVLQKMRDRGWQTLGIASARSRDGKTTVAANLAIAIAADPRHTALLVDLDLREPGVAGAFGLTPKAGVEDVIRGDVGAEACMVVPAPYDGVRLLPARTAAGSAASALVASAQCQALLGELRSRYSNRIVLCDMPPILECDDAVALAPYLDCVLLVVAEGATPRDDVARALHLIAKTPVIGTVLNRSGGVAESDTRG